MKLASQLKQRLVVVGVGLLSLTHAGVNIVTMHRDVVWASRANGVEGIAQVVVDLLCLCESDELGEEPVVL